MVAEKSFCSLSADTHAYLRAQNADGIYETALQCPQCGCSKENGALNLNDIKRNGYSKEQLAFFVAQINAKTTTTTSTTTTTTLPSYEEYSYHEDHMNRYSDSNSAFSDY